MREATKLQLEKLKTMLKGMDIPSYRYEDPKWLSRNLGVRNSEHPRFKEAMELISQLTRMGL